MKKCYALFIPLILMNLNFFGFILYAQPGWFSEPKIYQPVSKELSARILAEVFALSNPMNDPNDLIKYIKSNPQYFGREGSVTKAARDLGNWILTHDIEAFESDCLARIEKNLESDNMTIGYASDLLFEIKKNRINCKTIARELIWLSEVLPELTDGNLTNYLYTGTEIRQRLRNIIPVQGAIHNSDPEIAELILKDKNCYHQKIADQIQILALISNNQE